MMIDSVNYQLSGADKNQVSQQLMNIVNRFLTNNGPLTQADLAVLALMQDKNVLHDRCK